MHAEREITRAAKWTLLFRRLSKPSTGIKAELMRCIYCAVAVPRFTYVADVWFTPLQKAEGRKRTMGSVSTVCQLTSIQHIATTAITGTMRTVATDTQTSLKPMPMCCQ